MSESKLKVLCAVLTGVERTNWVNPDLMANLITIARDPRFEVTFCPVRDQRPWETARNVSIMAARYDAADWLISFDNDNYTHSNVLDIIASAGPDQHVIGLTYGVGGISPIPGDTQYKLFPDGTAIGNDGSFREVDRSRWHGNDSCKGLGLYGRMARTKPSAL